MGLIFQPNKAFVLFVAFVIQFFRQIENCGK